MSNQKSSVKEGGKHFNHVTGSGTGSKQRETVWKESTEEEIDYLEKQIEQLSKSSGEKTTKYLTPQQKDVRSKISDIELL